MPRAFLETRGLALWLLSNSQGCSRRCDETAWVATCNARPATSGTNLWNGCRVDFENLSYARFQPKLLRNSSPCASSSKVRLPGRCAPRGKGSPSPLARGISNFHPTGQPEVESNGTCPDNLSQSIPPGRTFQISLLVVVTQQSIGLDTYRTIISNISIWYVRLPISSNSYPCNEVAQECHPQWIDRGVVEVSVGLRYERHEETPKIHDSVHIIV
jgi:hypothetical protein